MDSYNKPPIYEYAYLAHHGILGQKWGVRRFQNKDGTLTRAGKQRYNADDNHEKQDEDQSRGKKKGLTDKQKRAIKIGAAVAVSALAAIGVYELNKHGKLDHLKEVGKNKIDELLGKKVESASPSITNGLKKLSRPESVSDVVTKVNPSGSRTNCRACSIASVLRMRGLDVEARGDVQGGTLREAVEDCFKDAKVAEIYSPSKDRITNYLLKRCGEGSSGVMSARYKTSTGTSEHATSWAVKNGVVSFFDGQKMLKDCSFYLDHLSPDGSAEISRLDNLELNIDGIKKYIKGDR